MKNIIATLIILHNIKSLLTPAHSPNGIVPLFEPQRKAKLFALLILREQNMRPQGRYFVLAEDVRFELTGRFTARRFSKPLV